MCVMLAYGSEPAFICAVFFINCLFSLCQLGELKMNNMSEIPNVIEPMNHDMEIKEMCSEKLRLLLKVTPKLRSHKYRRDGIIFNTLASRPGSPGFKSWSDWTLYRHVAAVNFQLPWRGT